MTNGPRIAIVGIGGLFPGAESLEQFWANIAGGVDASREVPPGRWLLSPVDALADGTAIPDHVPTSRGYYLDAIPRAQPWPGMAPERLNDLDPIFHLVLHAGRTAFAEAVTPNLNRDRVGVILGHIALPTEKASALTLDILGRTFSEQLGIPFDAPSVDPLNRYVAGLPAGLLAKALDLGGGWFTLDAACASSLYAVKLAADELRAGRADLMLAGGASRPDCLYTQMGFAQLRALSPSGRCSPFDSAGDGLMVGEGCGVLALKRLDDALRDGNTIHAILAGEGLSNDIEGGLLAPASEGQLRAMRAAYDRAGWSPSDVDLIECHATGTPVGDAIEFASLRSLWREQKAASGQCVIGSVKSTVGHLLTGAGAAGLIKLILALRHQSLPPTANFRTPSRQVDLDGSPFRILQLAEPWQRRDERTPRRAAISGFGFGGINAHLLLEEFVPESQPASAVVLATVSDEPIAIVGLDARFGPWQSQESFRQRIAVGGDGPAPASPKNWWGVEASSWFRAKGLSADQFRGFFIDEIEVPLGRFRIPPKELEEMLPQQMLALLSAAAALDDALGWEQHRQRAGIFLGLGLDLNTTNFHFRWWALEAGRTWRRQQVGQIDDGQFNNWLNELRNAAHPPLNANRTMGALGSIAASRVARAFGFGGPSFTVCSEETSGRQALQQAVQALRRGELDLALAGAVDLTGDVRAVLATYADGREIPSGEGAATVVLKRLSDALRNGDRIYAVVRDVHDRGPTETASDSAASRSMHQSVVEAVGHTGAASFMATLVAGSLALRDRFELHGKQPWLTNGRELRRIDLGGIVLEESLNATPSPIRREAETLLLLAADTPAELIRCLDELAIDRRPLDQIAAEFRTVSSRRTGAALGLSLLVRSIDELHELVAVARRHLAERPGEPLNDRVFYTPKPLGATGQLALVFPGSGNHYPGMGRDLALRWPGVLQRQHQENERLRDQFAPEHNWNGNHEIGPVHALFGQVTVGCLVSDVLAQFGVRPTAAIGYSLGESVSLFALRAWNDRDEMLRRMERSTLFTQELAGPCNAARNVWGMSPEEPLEWVVGVVPKPAEQVRQELTGLERAYLLIINTPDECVIGGERRTVDELARRLGSAYVPLPAVTIAHCELTRPVADAYRALHLFPTTPPHGVRYYSGVAGKSYDLTADTAADSILGHALGMIDFPRLIEQAYADGIRLFVEVGPGTSCSRMIGRILGDRLHLARSACFSQGGEVSNFLRLLALLHTHRVPLDLSPLDESIKAQASAGPTIKLKVGGKPFRLPPFPPVRTKPDVLPPPAPQPTFVPMPTPVSSPVMNPLLAGAETVRTAEVQAQEAFLRLREQGTRLLTHMVAFSNQLLAHALASPQADEPVIVEPRPLLDTAACFEYAAGSIGRALGPEFAEADSFPTRVRLPDGPLMLVDNIWQIEGQPRSMTSGRVVTDHRVHEGRWYIGEGHIPTAICVEAGQADLFLSGYLGIDFVTKGLAVYRLLDAVVTFHRELPRPGETIRYEIRIDRFFRQGDTHLFRFRFDGTVNGEPLLTMRDGCAGFFTAEELAAGRGIVHTALDRRPIPGKRPADWRTLAPMSSVESYDAKQLEALRTGDLAGCFGAPFVHLPIAEPLTLPGGMLKLVDRVTEFDPAGGRYGLGRIRAEMDIHPDDWFLTCHFVDDMVMPGTLMYECCLHTLRVALLRMGWIGEKSRVSCEPVPGIPAQLKCRGQVTASTKVVTYEVSIKELGYRPEPFVICDALMYADGKPIVEITNMNLRMMGTTREEIERLWQTRHQPERKAPLFDRDRITAFAIGNPSDAFGERYRVFDSERVIARLPGPPFQFLDRIIDIRGCQQWVMAAGGEIIAEYDVPPNEWYFTANRQPTMPFAVLLETALQPCGWLAAYLGSALTSDQDLAFRNLGGRAIQHIPVGPDIGTLTTWVKITRVSTSGGMIIQNYDFRMTAGNRLVYDGETTFGFFSRPALAQQVGVRDAALYPVSAAEQARGQSFSITDRLSLPDQQLRMMDRVELFVPDGGSKGLGYIRGGKTVNPDEWFFKAHFYQDPVWPGSLGLEAFLQLLKVVAEHRWGKPRVQTVALGEPHTWIYRGQVIPTNREVAVEADVTAIDDERRLMRANGYLTVDGRTIYKMTDFTLSEVR